MTFETPSAPRILLLPGWLNSDAGHWQSRWERTHGYRRVDQDDWVWPRRGDWMARLDDVLLESSSPAVLIAHSLGCQLVAAWAAHSQHTARVRAALLVAPPDTERADMPPNLFSWNTIARQRLPFVGHMVASEDDPFCTLPRAAQMAADWGCALTTLVGRGHINADSGLGDWPEGHALLSSLVGPPA
jgi:hypothetical protein